MGLGGLFERVGCLSGWVGDFGEYKLGLGVDNIPDYPSYPCGWCGVGVRGRRWSELKMWVSNLVL